MLDALALGTRHGLDPDHLAAISELTASQRGGWRGFALGIRYAAGHAAMVAAVGCLAGGAGLDTPPWLVGLTLVALGVWAMWRLRRDGAYDHEHVHDHRDGGPHDHDHEQEPAGPHHHRHRHAVAVGAVHGLGGAPAAVLAGGRGGLGLVAFTVGLLVANGVVGAVAGTTTRLAALAWAGAVAGTGYGLLLLARG